MVFLTLQIFTLVFCAIFYGLSSQKMEITDFLILQNEDMNVDVPQCIFFVLAILFSFYSFGLTLLRKHESTVKLADDHLVLENENKKELAKKATSNKEEKVILKDGKELIL